MGHWRPETVAVLGLCSMQFCFLLEILLSTVLHLLLFPSSLPQPEHLFLLVPVRWHAEEALGCLSLCWWLQGCHSGWAYSWGGSLFSQRDMGIAPEVSARYVVFFSTPNECVIESKGKLIWFMTVPKIAMCLCKSIVACTEERTKSMPDKDVVISHLSSFLILFMSELMNKVPHWVVRAVKSQKFTLGVQHCPVLLCATNLADMKLTCLCWAWQRPTESGENKPMTAVVNLFRAASLAQRSLDLWHTTSWQDPDDCGFDLGTWVWLT